MNQSLQLHPPIRGRSPILDGIGIFFSNYTLSISGSGFLFFVLVERAAAETVIALLRARSRPSSRAAS